MSHSYRFWRDMTMEEMERNESLTVSGSIRLFDDEIIDTSNYTYWATRGVEVYRGRTVGSQSVVLEQIENVSWNYLVSTTPSISDFAETIARMIQKESVFFSPVAVWRLGDFATMPDADVSELSATFSALPQDGKLAIFLPSASSHLSLPFQGIFNPPSSFSIEFWVRLASEPPSGSHAALVRSVGSEGVTGYIVGVSSGKWSFMLGMGQQSASPPLPNRTGTLRLDASAWSICESSTTAQVGVWTHIVATYNTVQTIFVDGVSTATKLPPRSFRPNLDGHVVFGGGCQTSDCSDASGCSASPACQVRTLPLPIGDGVLVFAHAILSIDATILYDHELTASLAKAHTRQGKIWATVEAKYAGSTSRCLNQDCTLSFSPSDTPYIFSIEPAVIVPGATIEIVGTHLDNSTSVFIGNVPCAVVPGSAIETSAGLRRLSCQDASPAWLTGARPVSFHVPSKGKSAGSINVEFIVAIDSVSPSVGSLLGGTTVTIDGSGLSCDSALESSCRVKAGPHECNVTSHTATRIICQLPFFSQARSNNTVLDITLVADRPVSTCRATTCAISLETSSTIFVSSLSHTSVVGGTHVTVTATSFFPESGSYDVLLGGFACPIASRTLQNLTFTVPAMHGGRHQLSVLHTSGYLAIVIEGENTANSDASTGQVQPLPILDHALVLTSVNPTQGSVYGGTVVTLQGTSFPSSIQDLNVHIGGRTATVLSSNSSVIVARTPASADSTVINFPRTFTSSDPNITTCASNLVAEALASQHASLLDGVSEVALPRGENSALNLMDGDLGSVWRSKGSHPRQVFLIDLGNTTTIDGLTLTSDYARGEVFDVKLSVATDCSQAAIVQVPLQPRFFSSRGYIAWPADYLGSGSGLSIEVWARPISGESLGATSTQNEMIFAAAQDARNVIAMHRTGTASHVRLWIEGTGGRTVENVLIHGVWVHLVWTIAGDGTWNIYIDGELRDTYQEVSIEDVQYSHIEWGRFMNNAEGWFWQGSLKPVRLLKRIMTASEVRASRLENQKAGELVTLENSALYWPPQRYASGDGFTIQLWAKSSGAQRNGVGLFSSCNRFNSGDSNVFIQKDGGSNALRFDIRSTGGQHGEAFTEPVDMDIFFSQSDVWLHITWSVAKNGQWKMYLNGVLKQTVDRIWPGDVDFQKIIWGGSCSAGSGGSNPLWAGWIVPAGISQHVASAEEIHTSYLKGPNGGPETSVMASSSSGISARYAVIEVESSSSHKGFGISEIAAILRRGTGQAEAVGVSSYGLPSVCEGLCAFNYSAGPEILSVNLSTAIPGDGLSITASNIHSCSESKVFIGMTLCSTMDCGNGIITCIVPDIGSGRHMVSLHVEGIGAASGSVELTVPINPTSVTPSLVSQGGGAVVTVHGTGFPSSPRISICGEPCSISSSSLTGIVCEMRSISTLPPPTETKVFVEDGTDDATEFVSTGTIVSGSDVIGFNMTTSDVESRMRTYLRFRIDAPANSTFSSAELHVHSAWKSCEEGEQLILRAEASDDAAPIQEGMPFGLSSRSFGSEIVTW